MGWTRVCALRELNAGSARLFIVGGEDVLFINGPDGIVALASVCRNVARFLVDGDFTACVVDGVPRCNVRKVEDDADADAPRGVCEQPIYGYALKEEDRSVYVDLERRRLSRYQHITCSPVVHAGHLDALQFSLWLDGQTVHRVVGRPTLRHIENSPNRA